jgi:hypothetical protein
LKAVLSNLKAAGCKRIYLNSSFVSEKKNPVDYDLCWESENVDVGLLDPLFAEVRYLLPPRQEQKDKYSGEIIITIPNHPLFDHLSYFQQDDRTGDSKGIVAINLSTLS